MTTENSNRAATRRLHCPHCEAKPINQENSAWDCGSDLRIQTDPCRIRELERENERLKEQLGKAEDAEYYKAKYEKRWPSGSYGKTMAELEQWCEKLKTACKHALLCINEPDMMSGLCPEMLEDALDIPADGKEKP